MAKKLARKKAKAPTRYSPAGVTTYPSEAAFNKTVNTRAQAQLKPGLDDIRARRRQELGAHSARTADIQGYYDYDLAARNAAQTRLNESLQGIMGRSDVMGAGSQEGLAAAVRQSQAGNEAASTQLGVQAPGVDPNVTNTLAAYNKGNQMGLAGEFGGYLAGGANDIAMTGIERREAGQQEQGTNTANLRALDDERKTAMATLPGLRDASRQSLLQEILANSQNKLAWNQFGEGRRSNKAQEGLAEDQFGLAEDQFGQTKKEFTEQKRARKFDEGQARKQSQLNQDQLDLARDELNAKVDQAQTDQEMAGAEDQAKRFDSAAQWLSGYLAPNDADYRMNANDKKVFSPKQYNARISFHEALVQIMNRYGMDRGTAYQILGTSSIPAWRRQADKYRQAIAYTGPH